MNIYSLDSGQKVVHTDYSTSAMSASLYQSSAVPTNLANIMRNALIIAKTTRLSEPVPIRSVPTPAADALRTAGSHLGAIWVSEDFDEPLPDEFWTGNA